MYLGHDAIIERIRIDKLLENHLPESIQGAGVDLRIDRLYEPKTGGFLGVSKRVLPELDERPFILRPEAYYLFVTMERVNMPDDLVAFMFNRSSLFRLGASLRTAVIDPGYRGVLTVGLKNEGSHEIEVEHGTRMLQIVFAKVDGVTKGYNGRYQGGKVV